MRVTVRKILPEASIEYNVTPFLDETNQQTLTQEIEIKAFERTVSDVQFSLSNLTGEFDDIFSNVRADYLFEVCQYNDADECRFWGYIDLKHLKFSLRDRYASFMALSSQKRFLENAKSAHLFFPATYGGSESITLDELFRYEIDQTGIHDYGRNFRGFDLGSFGSERVQWQRGPLSRGIGMFEDLSRNTTWNDLLKALALWFNAEFYVDPATRKLMMLRRLVVLNDRQVDLDPILCDDEDIDSNALADRVDYVKSIGIYITKAPSYASSKRLSVPDGFKNGVPWGAYEYCVGYEDGSGDAILSEIVTIDLTTRHAHVIDPLYGERKYTITLRIPVPENWTGTFKVYRTSYGLFGGFKLVGSSYADAETTFTDTMSDGNWPNQPGMTAASKRVMAWYRIDEFTNDLDVIYDVPRGRNTPMGTIQELIPQLKWVDPASPSVEKGEDVAAVYNFFTNRRAYFDAADLRNRWADLFRTRRLVQCKVRGTDWAIGDSVISKSSFFPNDLTADRRLVIRRATCDLINDTSKLELVTV